MSDRHQTAGLSWHPPDDLATWARDEAKRRGDSLSSLLTAALAGYREACGGPEVESTRQHRPSSRPAPAMTAAPPPVEAPSRNGSTCGHGFPDVKFVMGQRVCRKCSPATAL